MIGLLIVPTSMFTASAANMSFYGSPRENDMLAISNSGNIADPCPPFWQTCDIILFLTKVNNSDFVKNMTVSLNVTDNETNRTETLQGNLSEIILGLANSSLANVLHDNEKALTIDKVNHLLKLLLFTASDLGIRELNGVLSFSIDHGAAGTIGPPLPLNNSSEKQNGLNVSIDFQPSEIECAGNGCTPCDPIDPDCTTPDMKE